MQKITVGELVDLRERIEREGMAAFDRLAPPWPWLMARMCYDIPLDLSIEVLDRFRTNLDKAIEYLRAHPMEEPSLPEGSESLKWVIGR